MKSYRTVQLSPSEVTDLLREAVLMKLSLPNPGNVILLKTGSVYEAWKPPSLTLQIPLDLECGDLQEEEEF